MQNIIKRPWVVILFFIVFILSAGLFLMRPQNIINNKTTYSCDEIINDVLSKNIVDDPDPACTAEIAYTEGIGRSIYPISVKYKGTAPSDLGQLLTAIECGGDRVSGVLGVSGYGQKGYYEYVSWPDIGLYKEPSIQLYFVLKCLGFEPGSTCDSPDEHSCNHWTLTKEIDVKLLLLLKPYLSEIITWGCVRCG